MPDTISPMTPLLPEQADALQDLALQVIQRSASIGSRQHQVTLHSLRELLRIINSYYSNLIEGHNTHPHDIARAMQQQYDAEPAKRNLQLESVAHITVQRQMERCLQGPAPPNIAAQDFLCSLHRDFFSLLPEEFLVAANLDDSRESRVVPGKLREEPVKVGRHDPPGHNSRLTSFMTRFAEAYAPENHHGVTKLVAAAAGHHRLMWIHPFLDGNGRVARLFTEAYLQRIPVEGFGLWSVSRGLARKNKDYQTALTWADAPRRNDLDGRGHLSNEGLIRFCSFFLEVCLDQVEYMGSLLAQLVDEHLLVSDSPKGAVRIGLPIHAASWFFPELYPIITR